MGTSTTPDTATRSTRRERWIALPSNVKGAVFITAAAFFFVLMTMLIRLVPQEISIYQILLVRQCVMLVAALPIIVRGFPGSLRSSHPLHHGARVVLATVAMVLGFTAVRNIPLADATSLAFAKSFFLTIFAIVFLGEVVGIRRWAATIVGFVGVLIVLQPTGETANIYGLMAVGSAACAGLVMILLRFLTRYDKPITILTYQAVLVGILIAPFAISNWVTPRPIDLAIMIGIGLISIIAQSLNIQAFRVGEATFLASLDYSRLLWALLIGFAVFGEVPTAATMTGAAIVIGAAIYTIHREARRGRTLARSSAGRGFSGT